MRPSKVSRGLTLIELMVSLAIVSIILAAVTSVVVSVTRQRRESKSSVDIRTNGRVALSLMQFDATNAGFRFGAAPFAVRVLQNVTGGEPELADTNDCGGMVGWTVMPGTDVIEFRQGMDGLSPGKVPAGVVGCGAACGVAFNGGAYSNPFAFSTDGTGSVVFFSNATTACAGRLTSNVGGGAITMLRQDLRTNAAASTYPSSGAGACPNADMAITALGGATRYLVCQPPAGNPLLRPGLFRQTYGQNMALINYAMVQESVEDLQVATMVANQLNMVSGPTCTGAGLTSTCWCNLTVGGDCPGFTADATAGGILDGASATPAQRTAFLPRAFRISVTTIAPRARGFGDQEVFRRPAVFDHIAGTIPSGNQRTVIESTVIPQNIVMVTP